MIFNDSYLKIHPLNLNFQTCCEILQVKSSIPACKDLYIYLCSYIVLICSLEQFSRFMNSIKEPLIWLSHDFNAPKIL